MEELAIGCIFVICVQNMSICPFLRHLSGSVSTHPTPTVFFQLQLTSVRERYPQTVAVKAADRINKCRIRP